MPRSHPEGRDWVVERIAATTAPIVIDLGPGEGTYSDLARGWRPDAWWVGVEIWQPYVTRYDLWRKYDAVLIRDARNINFPSSPFVLLAGDVLEHMYRSDALDILHRAKEHAEAIMVSVPVVDYPQGHDHAGNPFEAHVDQWTFAQMYDALGPKVDALRGDVVGRFWWTRPQPEVESQCD
jgi:hypothetical protein